MQKTQEKRPIGREIPISPITSVEKGGFSQNGKAGTKGKSSKWLNFLANFARLKK